MTVYPYELPAREYQDTTPEVIAAEVERLRVAYNANAAELGWPQLDPQEWETAITTPLIDPRMELVRMEDRQHPGRNCAWCFHPRNSPECDFAKGHMPYREMFA